MGKYLESIFGKSIINNLVTAVSYFWLFPIVYYFYTYGRFTINAPFGDDISLIIGRAVDFFQADNIWEGLPFLFEQSEEYRVLFIALSGIISTKILGYINFSLIGLLGSISLFVAVLITICQLSNNSRDFRILATIAFFLLAAPIYTGCMFWTNCTIGHFGSIFFAVAACFFLARSGLINFIFFEAFLLLALFNLGNGICLLPIGFIGIWYCQSGVTKRHCFLMHSILCITIFISTFITFNEDVADLIRNYTLNTIIESPIRAAVVSAQWFLAWIGSWMSFSKNINNALVVGLLELIFLVIVCVCAKKELFKKYAHITLLIIFLLLTIIGASVLRAHAGIGVDLVFSDRFRIYSLVLVICLACLVLALVRDNKKAVFLGVKIWNVYAIFLMTGSAFYFAKAHHHHQPQLVAHKTQQLKCAGEWELNGVAKPCLWHGDNKIIMDRATEMGILHINKGGTEPLRCQAPYLKYCWK